MDDLRTLSLYDLLAAMRDRGERGEAASQEVQRRTKLLNEKNKRARQVLKVIKQQMKMAGIK